MSFDTDAHHPNLAIPGTEFNDCGDEGYEFDIVPLGLGEGVTVDGGKISLDSAELTGRALGFRAPNPMQIIAGGLILRLFNFTRQRGEVNARIVSIVDGRDVNDVVVTADFVVTAGVRTQGDPDGITLLPAGSTVMLDSSTLEFSQQYGEPRAPVCLRLDIGIDSQIGITNEAGGPVTVISANTLDQAYDAIS